MTQKTIFITGIGNGIGRALAVFYTQLGWRVAGLDPDDEALTELREGLDGDLLLVPGDAGREADVIDTADRLSEWLDGAPLTCLVNNAGIADPYARPLEDLSLADFQSWIDASLTAAFLCSRSCLPFLRRGEGGSIVNISSTRAVMSEPDCFGYAAAKGGLDALTHAMAVSLGPDIRVKGRTPRAGQGAAPGGPRRATGGYRRYGPLADWRGLRYRAGDQRRWWHDGEDDLRGLT